jgi:hypothetical protein
VPLTYGTSRKINHSRLFVKLAAMWNVATEYRQGREVKDDKNRKRDCGLEKRLDRITISDI